MVRKSPIRCNRCLDDSGYTQEELMYRVLPRKGLKCKRCGKVFVKPGQADW